MKQIEQTLNERLDAIKKTRAKNYNDYGDDFVHRIAQENKARAEAAASEAGDDTTCTHDTPAPAPASSDPSRSMGDQATHKGNEPKPVMSIVPYTIIRCLSSLDNIYETRLFGWTLAKAQSVLKLYNKDLSEINIESAMNLTRVRIPARMLLCDGDKNYSNITKAFTLATKKIEIQKEGRLLHLNIIAFPELVKNGRHVEVTYVIHNDLWHALLDFSKGYRLFSLETYMKLSSKYSVILYLLISQQSGPKNYTAAILRQLLGVGGMKSYEHSGNFFARCIDPARRELMEKAPYYFEYSATKDGRNHRIAEIILTPVLNQKQLLKNEDVATQADTMRLRLDESVHTYIAENFKMRPREIETIEPLLMRIGDSVRQLAFLGEVKERTRSSRVKKPAGYLVRSLQNRMR